MHIVRTDPLTPALLTDHVEETWAPSAVGLEVTYHFSHSSVWPSAQLERVNIRGPYQTGIRLDNCWNAHLDHCFITGSLAEEQYANPTAMQVGIDLVGAMDAHIRAPRITSATIGIRASTAPEGFPRCEGLHVDQGWLMHVRSGIELNGSMLGGWPTPAVWISRMHVNFLTFGVRGDVQSGLHIEGMDLYASHYKVGQWGIYLTGCKNVIIDGNHFWCNRPGFYGAIVLDACENVQIAGGIVDDSLALALHATKSCRNVTISGTTWDRAVARGQVANYAT